MNDLDVELVQAEVNAQLMTLVQGPSMRLPGLAHSPEGVRSTAVCAAQLFRQGDLLPDSNPRPR